MAEKNRCPDCNRVLDDRGACPRCAPMTGTPTLPVTDPGAVPEAPADTGCDGGDDFTVGDTVADRYRILGRLGAGGMGSVYRADDLRLGQEVALKFLTRQCGQDERGIAMLLNEVRLARRVSHPNVCRVHDIGELEGRTFISMEYVDGEDLASLLRRIGHLSGDKAAQIARQLCAGLHAAHEQGVLHRDLKPANVMIDGRGDVRITDFGIAGVVSPDGSSEGASGTPAYMAPELFTGATATTQSDVYSLGLVLYELYTGKRLFQASTMTELLRLHRRPVRPPSELVPQLGSDVEQTILACLEREPARRPRSAFAVLAGLPGGDPLAAALATGKTPSRELVAEAQIGWRACALTVSILAAVIVVGLGALFWLERDAKLIGGVALPKSAEVLADRAREHLGRLGFQPSRHRAFGFDVFHELLDEVRASVPPAERAAVLARGQPSAIDFWYRESPRPLVPAHISGEVAWADPPAVVPGMVALRLDPAGNLRELRAVPDPSVPTRPIDWNTLFAAAGLDPTVFEPCEPTRLPAAFADARVAFCENGGDDPETRLLVEAAALRGVPVSFTVIPRRWQAALGDGPARLRRGPAASTQAFHFFFLLAAGVLAWSNLRRGRGDRQGAFRLGFTIFLLVLAVTLLCGTHTADLAAEGQLLLNGMARGLLVAAQYWLFYTALEPHVRRLWPETIIAWSRLLAGRVRDPAVGFNVIVGIALGVLGALAVEWASLLHGQVGEAARVRDRTLEALLGAPSSVGAVVEIVAFNTGVALSFLFALVFLRIPLRSKWLAAFACAALHTVLWTQIDEGCSLRHWFAHGALAAVGAMVLVRVGLVALMFGSFALNLLLSFPLVLDLSHWQAGSTFLAVALTLGGTAFGAFASLRR